MPAPRSLKETPHVFFRLTVASAAIFLLSWPMGAMAQPVTVPVACDLRDRILDHLAQKYDESPVAIGVTNKGGLVEVLTSGDGGTWTIIVTFPNGTSCLVAAGEGWRSVQRLDPET